VLRLIVGFLATGLLLVAPGPLGVLAGEGSRWPVVTLVWLLLAGIPGGKPASPLVLLGCALPSTLAALGLDPQGAAADQWPHLILGWTLIFFLGDAAWRAQANEALRPGTSRVHEIAWWGCLILPQSLALILTWGGMHTAPAWLQGIVNLGPWQSFLTGELPQRLSAAPLLILVPWLLSIFPRGPHQ